MNGNKTAVAALGAGALVCVVGLVGTPMLESAQLRADRQAERHVETARRLLASYNPEADLSGALLADLAGREVDVHLDKSPEKLDDADFQTIYEGQRDASVELYNSQGDRRPKGGNSTQIREGVKAHKELVKDNQGVLKAALAEVDAALSISIGDASTRSNPAANRLKGAIQYEQARTTARGATLHRSGMAPLLSALSSLNEQARIVAPRTALLSTSGVDAQIAKVDGEIESRQKDLAAITAEWQTLQTQVKDHEAKLASARQTAETERLAFEAVASRGMDFAKPDALDQFQKEHSAHSEKYRQAVRAAQEAEFGVYPKALIDQSGDYLKGRLLENGGAEPQTQQLGLSHYQAEFERADAAKKLAEQSLADLREQRVRMKSTRDAMEADQGQATEELKAIQGKAGEVLAAIKAADAAATAAESAAVAAFTQAAASFKAGLDGAVSIMSAAAERTRDISPEAAANSAFTKISQSGQSVYHIATEQAESLAGAAWIHQQAYAASQDAAALIEKAAAALSLPADAAGAFADAAAKANQTGVDTARKAAEVLQRSHEQVGGHWTVAAELAGTGYLFVLFGDQAMLADVKANYRNALDGRDDEPLTRPLKERLDYLEKR
ncbi:MAG: hypothetical protein IT449_11200 [Phycisphaerales bacterium]|nr:hypothetical protein [Phycisphaerales bacterium]